MPVKRHWRKSCPSSWSNSSDWAVKSNITKKGATSDLIEIARQRGISVATSVLAFEYKGIKINILDIPGHNNFAEDTFRTLTVVDSVIVVINVAKGVEE
jgi:peptide chain release factor 3